MISGTGLTVSKDCIVAVFVNLDFISIVQATSIGLRVCVRVCVCVRARVCVCVIMN